MKILQATDFQLVSCQATLFTPDEEVSAARVVRDLLPKWSDRFDGDPVMIPAVDGLPKEVPRITLHSKSNGWRCDIASGRVNLFWRRVSKESDQAGLSEFYAEAAGVLSEYIRLANPRVGRCAAVLNWYAPHNAPGLFLARHFCKEQWHKAPLNRPESFELHAHKKYSLCGTYTVNSWVRSKTGSISIGNQNETIVLVEQDMNTPAEEIASRSYTEEQFKEFFGLVADEFVNILRLYYPE